MKDFEYYEPASIQDAIDALARLGGEARILAGGTDLLVKMKRGALAPANLVNLKRVPGLGQISVDRKVLRLGALTTLRDLEKSSLVRQWAPVVAAAAGKMASTQIRCLATAGGNLCNAAPSADLAPPLIALGATVRFAGPRGQGAVALEDFFTGPGQTVLAGDEVVTEIEVPEMRPGGRAVYYKHGIRRAMDIAIAGVAVRIDLDEAGRCSEARVVLGSVAPTPIRSRSAESRLRGAALGPDEIAEAAELAAADARPISDVRSSAEYRREMVKVLTRRALEEVSR